MNVANLLKSRVKEVAAFSTLLFQRKRSRSSIDDDTVDHVGNEEVHDDGGCGGGGRPRRARRRAARYRRPSSANVPLSDVLRFAKSRVQRANRFARSESSEKQLQLPSVRKKKQKKRVLTYEQWCLLLKRRRRLALRQRPTVCRRLRQRAIALRQGRKQQAFCRCGADPASLLESPRTPLTEGGRTCVLWLPSHWQLRRRFHYHIVKTRVDGCRSPGNNLSQCVTVRIAAPTASQRKQHRVLQRWVARLPVAHGAVRSSRRHAGKPTALPPPMCFAAERSHLCVWCVQPVEKASNMSPETVMDLLMMRTNGASTVTPLYTRNIEKTLEGITPLEEGWQRSDNSVFYGYMWSGAAKEDVIYSLEKQEGRDDSTPASLIVPVVLLSVRHGNDYTAYHLVAPAPVYIGARARRNLDIRLASHWNPCGAPVAICSVFELWCSADAVKMQNAVDTPISDESLIMEWVGRRVEAAVVRWRAAGGSGGGGDTSFHTRSKGQQVRVAAAKVATGTSMTVCSFPSIPPTTETVDHGAFPIHRCVMQILVLSPGFTPYSENFGTNVSPLWRRRKDHFQFARHLFFSLTSTTTTLRKKSRGCNDKLALALSRGRALGYTHSVRVIGEEERETLLRLAGCPALEDESGSNAAFQTPTARLRCSLSNAHQRVLLKFSARGGREHQNEGSALLVLLPRVVSVSSGAPPAELRHIGAVTSAPFFSMRFGCRLAYAWVWDHPGWVSAQLHTRQSHPVRPFKRSCDSHDDSVERIIDWRTGSDMDALCFFTSATGNFSRLLPHLSHSPVRIPGCGSAVSFSQVEKVAPSVCSSDRTNLWCETEAVLCDANVCLPVEVVRFGTAVGAPLPEANF